LAQAGRRRDGRPDNGRHFPPDWTIMSTPRTNWSSRLGFILTAAGSAVGLGCIWKFPYVAVNNGGGAFLLIFLAITATLGYVLLQMEMALGRHAGTGVYGAFRRLGGRCWAVAGAMAVLTSALVLSFYSVVGGWTIAYGVKAAEGQLANLPSGAFGPLFAGFISTPGAPLLYQAIFVALTLYVVVGGVQQSIEQISKYLMPLLLVLVLVLIGRVLTLPGAVDGMRQFLQLDFAQVTGHTIIAALGLSFFSLSLGVGVMTTYGSYMGENTAVPGSALWVVLITMVSSILGGLLVLPAVFAFGIDPASGPGLTFISMPQVFAHLPAGSFFACLFFGLLLIAALTSSVSLLEVSASFFMDQFGWSRGRATTVPALLILLAGIPASLSFGPLSDWRIGGKTIFDALDYLTSNLLLPLGGMATALLASWVAWRALQPHLARNGRPPAAATRLLAGVVGPLLIGVILWQGLTS